MTMSDTLGDGLARIKNAAGAGHETVTIPHSNLMESVFKILKTEGFFESVEIMPSATPGGRKQIVCGLKYRAVGQPALKHLKRVSSPGQRIYRKTPEKGEVRSGFGFQILSTSKGVMTDKQAIERGVGGEVIAEVW